MSNHTPGPCQQQDNKVTDRELIEIAATVAGYKHNGWHFADGSLALEGFNDKRWNPLTDDGDALRLAVKLEIDICFGANYVIADGVQQPTVNNANDPCAAVRQAIVRAAAELAAAPGIGAA